MGRKPVSLAIDSEMLRKALEGRETFSERAAKYGVSRQAVANWLAEGRMPPRALAEIAMDLNLPAELVDAILAPSARALERKKKWVLTITFDEVDR